MDILGQKIHISDTAFEEFSKLKDQVNKKIIIGFRPEAVSYDTSISGECVVRLRVSGLESTGHETLVYFSNSTSSKPAFMPSSATDIGRTDNIVARLPGNVMIQSGTEALLSIDVNKLYYFDEKGMALY
jgi:ABC-type sugar transport system ATPase subunit